MCLLAIHNYACMHAKSIFFRYSINILSSYNPVYLLVLCSEYHRCLSLKK
jgi:hypothetical protein